MRKEMDDIDQLYKKKIIIISIVAQTHVLLHISAFSLVSWGFSPSPDFIVVHYKPRKEGSDDPGDINGVGDY